MTKSEFTEEIYEALKHKPAYFRDGQFVFNYIDREFGGVARKSQFEYGIDCFYRDEQIPAFIDKCYELIQVK